MTEPQNSSTSSRPHKNLGSLPLYLEYHQYESPHGVFDLIVVHSGADRETNVYDALDNHVGTFKTWAAAINWCSRD